MIKMESSKDVPLLSLRQREMLIQLVPSMENSWKILIEDSELILLEVNHQEVVDDTNNPILN